MKFKLLIVFFVMIVLLASAANAITWVVQDNFTTSDLGTGTRGIGISNGSVWRTNQ